MFLAALVWLGYLAALLHFHERAHDAPVFWSSLIGLALLTPVFWIEAVWAISRRACNVRSRVFGALMPILRIGVRDSGTASQLWLPGMGWRTADARLQNDVAKALNGPMLAVAVLVLPVILAEFLLHERMETDLLLARSVQFGTAVIWWSFTVEFVLMVSITDKKLDYCKRHWLDLAIILLPFLFFLRALRLGQLLRLQNLSKTARVYKLRGVAMRTYRALLLLEFVSRLLQGSPERRLARLKERLEEHEAHGQALRAEIAELEAEISRTQEQAAAA